MLRTNKINPDLVFWTRKIPLRKKSPLHTNLFLILPSSSNYSQSFQEKINEAFLLTSFFIIFCTTLTLCLVFVPKVVELFRTPRGTDSQRYRKGMMKSVVGKNSDAKLHRQLSM
jgi:gamma-aminobutyric acid type B receptor